MMKIDYITVGLLSTNCYILQDGGKCAIIDPGGDFGLIDQFISANGLDPVLVMATHGHFDHVFSAWDFLYEYGLKLHINSADIKLLGEAEAMSLEMTGSRMNGNIETITFEDGHEFQVGGSKIQAQTFPGHTPGSTIFMSEAGLFTGDTVFKGTIGRVDFGGSILDMRRSLDRFRKINGDHLLFPGHGDFTTLDDEKRGNPYLSDAFISGN
ncbi:MAG: MBL fold metallo-hydrolase [Thermoplasmataceae archaeon]